MEVCDRCSQPQVDTNFVFVEISQDTTRGGIVDLVNKVAVANNCGARANETWGVMVEVE